MKKIETTSGARVAVAVVALMLSMPGAAQDMRNTLTLTVDVGRQQSRPLAGADTVETNGLIDLEFARSLWRTLELTFAGNIRRIRQDTAGVSATHSFAAYQIGARQYLLEPRRTGWTPYIEGSGGEGWLEESTAGEIVRQRFYGFELGAGAALHFGERLDLRLGANYEWYHAWDKVGDARDQLSRFGVRIGAAYRF